MGVAAGPLKFRIWYMKSLRSVWSLRRLWEWPFELSRCLEIWEMRKRDVRFSVLCCVLSMPIERLFAVSGRKQFEEREQAGNTDYGAHNVVHVGCVDNHVRPMVMMLSKKGQPQGLWANREIRLTWLFLQSQIPRIAKGHFTHYIEGHIVELFDNVYSLFPILALDAANRVQELISTTYQNIFMPHQIGHAERKAKHSPHTWVLFLIAFVDNVHGVVDLWCEEARIFCHRGDIFRAEIVDDLLSVVVVEA